MAIFWGNLPIRVKNIVLIILSTGLLYCIYLFNIKKTVLVIKNYKTLNKLVNQQPNNIDVYQKNYPNKYKTKYTSSEIISDISAYSQQQNIEIDRISQIGETNVDQYTFEIIEIIISGTYTEILDVMFQIEYIYKFKSLNSASMELIHNKEMNNHTLQTKLYIKTIKYEKPS